MALLALLGLDELLYLGRDRTDGSVELSSEGFENGLSENDVRIDALADALSLLFAPAFAFFL